MKNKFLFFICLGIVFILIISILQGFEKEIKIASEHLIKDLTDDLQVHIYLAGFILVISGIYFHLKDSYAKKK